MPVKLELGGGLGAAVQAVQTVAMWSRLAQGFCPAVLSPSFAVQEATRERFASTLPGMRPLHNSDETPEEAIARVGGVLVTNGREPLARRPTYHQVHPLSPQERLELVLGEAPDIPVEERLAWPVVREGRGR